MSRFVHGGDTYGMGDVLDFSASLNPLGLPERVVEALRENAAAFGPYPDPDCRDLTAALAMRLGAPPERIVMTAGAGDAFTRIAIALKPQAVVLCDPCYSGYEQALSSAGLDCVRIRHVALSPDRGFAFDAEAFAAALDGADLVYLCSPNNPTGRAVDLGELHAVLDAARAAQTVVVFDECFAELAGLPSAVGLCDDNPELVIVRAFTKTFALAGLRLGYCVCADEDLLERFRVAGVPWAVSAPAQVAGLAALEETDYLEESRALVIEQRSFVETALAGMGIRTVPSCANFILFRSEERIYNQLLERGICIRLCSSFEGLDGSWFRVGLRMPSENRRFIEALEEVLS